MKKTEEITITTDFSATQAFVEVGLGSVLHAFHLPLSGQFLSLVQIFISSRARLLSENKMTPAYMGAVVSCLKSLSPAGKRLTPMLAISMQGLLLSVGEIVLGSNLIGRVFGAILSGLWSFLQPILLIWILVGEVQVQVLQKIISDIEEIIGHSLDQLYVVLFLMMTVKVILSIYVLYKARSMTIDQFEKLTKKLAIVGQKKMTDKLKNKKLVASDFKLALKDLFQPLILISVLLSGIFFYYSQSEKSGLIWVMLRPIATAFILFYMFRKLNNEKIIQWLRQKPDSKLAQILLKTIHQISQL